MTGVALSQSGLGRLTRGAAAAVIVGANLPDIDLLFGLGGSASYLDHHRDLSHSIAGGPVLAVALAVALRLSLRGSRFAGLLLAALAGVAVHVFMDLWTSYGTRVLSPFDRTFYAWDLVFIVDPAILLMLLATVFVARRPSLGARAATVGLGLVLAYVGGRAVLHARAIDELVARVPGGSVRRAVALPSPIDPFAWRALADTGPAYWTGEVRLGKGSPPLERRDKLPESPEVSRARAASEVAAIFLAFSTFPWLEVNETPDGTSVTWRDLRFERRGRESFFARVLVGPDGRIRSQVFQF